MDVEGHIYFTLFAAVLSMYEWIILRMVLWRAAGLLPPSFFSVKTWQRRKLKGVRKGKTKVTEKGNQKALKGYW